MSAKLDKSLDEILSSRRQGARRGSQRRRDQKPSKAHGATTTPVGGVKKAIKHAKPATKAMPTGPSTASGESKIIVSGLVSPITPFTSLDNAAKDRASTDSFQPSDVNEANIKVC